ncbi:MAG: hypothetical protein JNJ57_18655 [Saprospiraceae bacterium]|nr:hypothetical protein [Saprospiraceae bacterium]
MKYKFGFIFLTLTFFWTSHLTAQNSIQNDSTTICKTVSGFFEWYIDAIKQKKQTEYQPTFVESESGMTTLNFSKYFANLVSQGFSDTLIIKERLSYQSCIENLEKIKYSDFNSNVTDLDDFEKIECDFSNYYRWTGGQEPIDGIRIKTVKLINSFSAIVIIEYFDFNTKEKKNFYWGRNTLTMTKPRNTWQIDNINWK